MINTRLLHASAALMMMALNACHEQPSLVSGPEFSPRVAAAAAKPASNVPVGITIKDKDASGALLLTRSDNPTAGAASYPGGVILSTGGAFQLYLGSQTARTVWLTLASQGMSMPDGYYYANVEVYSQCFTDSTGATLSSLTGMSIGGSNSNCSFGVDFSSGGVKYKLAMSPKYAGTGHAIVTCTAQGSVGCTGWTILPWNGANVGVARLFKFSTNRSLVTLVTIGDFHNSYAVDVTR